MNKARRNRLESIISTLEEMRDELQSIAEEEREAFDNLPESLQYSERGELMEENADSLESSYDELDSIISDIQETLENSF